MDNDISKSLAFQVKRELAERYFGTRKFIEDEIVGLKEMVVELKMFYVDKIGRDLVRIYALLRDHELIREFMNAAGWKEIPFYDEYVLDSESIRHRLMEPILITGWFSKGKFINMLIDSYERLYHDWSDYSDLYNDVREEYEVIKEEVRQFRVKYSLDEIMSFVGELDEEQAPDIMGVVDSGGRERLAGRMELSMPPDIMQDVVELPSLPRPDMMKKTLEDLGSKAEPHHREEVIAAVSEGK